MKIILAILIFLSSYSVKSQYYFSREKIRFYIDGELLTKDRSDSITVLVKKGNDVFTLKDSLHLGKDGDNLVSLHFMLNNRVMTFKDLKINTNFDEISDETAAFKIYEFRYTHIDRLIPYTRKNLKEAGFNDYNDIQITKNTFFDPNNRARYRWYFGEIKLDGENIKNEDLLYGVASFSQSKSVRYYCYYDFKLGNESMNSKR